MLIPAQTTLALRCPNCGKLGFHSVSRFALGRGKQIRLTCECGAALAAIGTKGSQSVYLQVECMLCERRHLTAYKNAFFWNGQVKPVVCEESAMETGFIGPREEVREAVQRLDRSMRELSEDMGYDKYFLNPEIMYKILEWLKKMTEEGKVFCSCGANDLEVEAYQDRVEIYCTGCEAVGVIPAETTEDWNWVNRVSEFVLEARKYCRLDHKCSKRGRSRKRNT
ncbi:MAG: hypothetical protein RBT41_11740 [Clostridia bacterium]|jgi:hypothetical protein|nr:hypothetical protein [Clostridia bacterium]